MEPSHQKKKWLTRCNTYQHNTSVMMLSAGVISTESHFSHEPYLIVSLGVLRYGPPFKTPQFTLNHLPNKCNTHTERLNGSCWGETPQLISQWNRTHHFLDTYCLFLLLSWPLRQGREYLTHSDRHFYTFTQDKDTVYSPCNAGKKNKPRITKASPLHFCFWHGSVLVRHSSAPHVK